MLGAVCLSGSGAQFRGFLVQARSVADESPVGSFTASGTGQRLSSCTTPEVSAQNKEKNISYSSKVCVLIDSSISSLQHMYNNNIFMFLLSRSPLDICLRIPLSVWLFLPVCSDS